MLGEKLAELVSFIGEDKAEALSVHSAIESDFQPQAWIWKLYF